ncbi:putative TIM-barrel fold metal-dependent hydrolase [Roseimicrobium gellanilyticum]|uniref:Putative TIM-barrel fold metal-dependent hydrolase n=1 Tax=Roseimicrobium gellanilyticum TaxID=748857 RepID=A0A366H9P8_9BACT|nr:amidohydrolase family protein [Roseimicrobium gellanilyticum]RBP39000.1 putative TIM-barrel fold metal-dependent hydrolase [Roseimicrobium gellanilyticum]
MLIDCHNHIGADLMFYLHGDFPYAQQMVDMLQEGSSLGVTHWIAFPFVSYAAMDVTGFREGSVRFGSGTSLEMVPYAFENRRLLEECQRLFPEEGKKVLPFVMVDPMRDTGVQARELEKLREQYRFYGIKIQSTIIQSDIKRLAHEGSIFLDLARQWDIPFLIHSSVAESDLWAQAHDIIDIAEANPDIRFCAAHSCRYDKECLDRIQVLPNAWFDCSAHCIHCKGVVDDLPYVAPRERRFDTDYTDPARVIADLAAAYPDKFLWGSDSPFYSYAAEINEQVVKLISTYEAEVAALKKCGEEVVRRVADVNTRAYLKLADENILA